MTMQPKLANSALCLFLGIIAACNYDSGPNKAAFSKATDMEKKATEAANLCLWDAHHVLPEHSGNCLAVARYLNAIPKTSECFGRLEKHPKCKELLDGYHQIFDFHWRAVASSLAREHSAAGLGLYRDEKAMSSELEKCLHSQHGAETICVVEGSDNWPKPL